MTVWIDTHCHLDAPEFDGDRDRQREAARAAGVALCVLPAVAASNFATVRELAHRFGDAYALGIHPLFTPAAVESDLQRLDAALARAASDPRCVAVGEIGLDHFVPGLDRARQLHWLTEQLRLARQHRLPVVLHVRRSADALLAALRTAGVSGGIAHAFNGSRQQAHGFLDRGFRLGFGGAVTHERALQLRRLAASLPADALVLETDAPDIPPQWLYRTAAERAAGAAQGRNSPAQLPRIGAAVAALRGVPPQVLAAQTCANACAALPRLAALLDAADAPPTAAA